MSTGKPQVTKVEVACIIVASLSAIATVILGFITFYQGKNIEYMQSKIEKLAPPAPQGKPQKNVCNIADVPITELQSTSSDSRDNYLSLTLKRAIELARMNNKELRVANRADKKRLFEELSFRVVRSYRNLQQADAQVEIAEAMVKTANQNQEYAEALERAGVGKRSDVLIATVRLANAQQNLNFSVANQQVARLHLTENLNLNQPKELRVADKLEEAGSWNFPLAESVTLAYENTEQTQRNININTSDFDNPCNQIRLEVATAYFYQSANQKNLEISSKTVETAKEIFRLAQLRYQAGVNGAHVDIIEAQTVLTLTQNNRLRTITDYNQSLNTLQWTVGKPLENK